MQCRLPTCSEALLYVIICPRAATSTPAGEQPPRSVGLSCSWCSSSRNASCAKACSQGHHGHGGCQPTTQAPSSVPAGLGFTEEQTHMSLLSAHLPRLRILYAHSYIQHLALVHAGSCWCVLLLPGPIEQAGVQADLCCCHLLALCCCCAERKEHLLEVYGRAAVHSTERGCVLYALAETAQQAAAGRVSDQRGTHALT